MRIGIDFDNTISNYDKILNKIAFQKKLIRSKNSQLDKTLIKKIILKKTNTIESWKKIQSQIYGELILEANVNRGFNNFIFMSQIKKYEIFIVSHKTKYAHYNKNKINLREQALLWMKKNKFFNNKYLNIKIENVYFENSLKNKISRIRSLKCDYFIDDLIKVFDNKNFPNFTKKILYNNNSKKMNKDIYYFSDWDKIRNYFFKKNHLIYVKKLYAEITKSNNFKIKTIKSRANSDVFKIVIKNKKLLFKIYPNSADLRERLLIEFKALNFLSKNKIINVPKPILKNKFYNVGIYEYLDGESIKTPNSHQINAALLMIKKLRKLYLADCNKFNIKASEACFNFNSLKEQIDSKFNELTKLHFSKTINKFIKFNLTPLWKIIHKNSRVHWPQNNINNYLKKYHRTFSPSDFGFHNSIIKNKKVRFIDFEYFGHEDPVKIMSDFLWHPAMKISKKNSLIWQKGMFNIFSGDKMFKKRFYASHNMYGIRWILIMLKYLSKENNKGKSNLLTDQNMKNKNLKKIMFYFKKLKTYDNIYE